MVVNDLVGQPRRLAAVAVALPDGVTPAGTRGRILRAGLALFAEHGFHGTSIRQLATRAEITSATLYAHYPAKEHVLAELVRIGHEELHARLTEAMAAVGGPTAATNLLVDPAASLNADLSAATNSPAVP